VGKYLELLTTEDGWEYVRRVNCPGVVIVLVYHTGRDQFLMVEQYRPPVKCRVLEWPAGLMDEGETPKGAAVRELYEETGVVLQESELIDLGIIFSGVGMTDEEVNIYAAEIDDSTQIDAPDIKGAEVEHELQTRWISGEELLRVKAAKALSVYSRYLAKKSNPSIVFDED